MRLSVVFLSYNTRDLTEQALRTVLDAAEDMAVEVFAAEFPEFLMAIAEENFLRGYQLGIEDATTLTTEAEAVTGNEE